MHFKKTSNDDTDTSIKETWASESGRFLIEVRRVMFGCRVSIRQGNDFFYHVDYCFGNNQMWIEAGVVTLARILECYDEATLDLNGLTGILPRYTVRPMLKDPQCWAELTRLAGVSEDPQEVADLIDEYDPAPNRDYFNDDYINSLVYNLSSRGDG